jgi:hydrogenase nickel incorporation protein HypA/HybF
VHEVSLAEGIVRAVEAEARGRRVGTINVRIGALQRVVADSLSFGVEMLSAGTNIEGAEIVIEPVPARIACRRCAAESEVSPDLLACPRCNSFDVAVTAGEECHVTSIEVEEAITKEVSA